MFAVLAFSSSLLAQNAVSQPSSETIATVNTESITQADLDRVRSARADTALELPCRLMDERFLVQRCKSLGYGVSEQQYQAILENLEDQNKIRSDEQLYAALKRSNISIRM